MRLPKLFPVLVYMALAACTPAAVKPPAGRIVDSGQAGSTGAPVAGTGGSGVAGTGGSPGAGTGGSGGGAGMAGDAPADARPMVVNPPPRPPPPPRDARPDVGGGGGDDDNLLYVTGSGATQVSDTELIDYLEDRGYDVTTETDTSITLADTEGKAAILLSGSVTAATVVMTLPQLVTMATPIVVMDENLEPLLNMTAAPDEAHNNTPGTQVVIPADAENDLTGNLEGMVTVYAATFDVGWGVPGPGALRGATVVGNNGQLALYAYPAGAMMANNVTAPGKRVFFFFRETNTANLLNEDGLELFEAAVEFASED